MSLRNSDTAIYRDSDFTDLSAQNDDYPYVNEHEQYGFSKKSKKRGKKKFGILFGVLAALIGIIVGVVCFGYWYKEYLLNKITYETRESGAVVTIVNEKGETVVLNEVHRPPNSSPFRMNR